MSKPFNLEAFKAGQKALTRDGRIATFIGINSQLHKNSQLVAVLADNTYATFYCINGSYDEYYGKYKEHRLDLVSMVSRHQHLIDSYDPEDTWQFKKTTEIVWDYLLNAAPEWLEDYDYRIHPHNDLINAFKIGKEIVATNTDGNEVPLDCLEDLLDPRKDWDDLRIKTEPEFEYPIYKKTIDYSGLIVKFLSLTQGEVVERGNTCYTVGQIHNYWYEHTDSFWQDWTPITKSKLTTHCLAYDASLDPNPKLWGPPVVSEKQFAIKKGWTIIQEWEV